MRASRRGPPAPPALPVPANASLPKGAHLDGRRTMARAQLGACLICFIVMSQLLLYYGVYGGHLLANVPTTSTPPPPSPDTSVTPPSPPQQHTSAATELPRARIPKLIHQSWRDGGFPKGLFNWRWQQGIVDLNPGWRLVKWTDQSSRELIATEYSWFLPTYDAYPSYIQRSDAARYFILYHHGGVYADLDIECSKPFGPVLSDHRAVFSYKQGTNMSRGLVNALFASEAKHPLWKTVFNMLTDKSKQGASAATHVDVVRSTGPGLLREALLTLQDADGDADGLSRLGVVLLDASVWHPILAEQKRGRDSSDATARAIAQSSCYHHFVSSWMTHDKEKHDQTESQRTKPQKPHKGGANNGNSINGGGGPVPTGQGIRTTNPWKSYETATAATDAASLAAGDGGDGEAEQHPQHAARPNNRRQRGGGGGGKGAMKSFLKKGYEKRKAQRERAYAASADKYSR